MTTPSPTTTERAATEGTGAPRLDYMPALDGLRGLAVAGVLLFHAQLLLGGEWVFRGGYLGVSTFFTLSGFLITFLLLAEHRSTGRIDTRRFWSRRFRRLLPAAWVTLGLVVLYGSGVLAGIGFAAEPSQLRSLRGDLLASLLHIANWRFLVDGQSYGELFDEPSPVLHFWSLAIEEQFYILFPLLAIGVLGAARGSLRLFGGVIAALTAASLLAGVALGFSQDRIYFGTDTRASELLVGALLAVALAARRRGDGDLDGSWLTPLSSVALVVSVLAWVTVGQGTDWLYAGGFTAYALASAAVILACAQGRGPVAAVLATAPLVWLGRISYGVYLYHWIIFQWLDESLTGLGPWPLLVLRVAVTLVLATLSYRFIEQPIRSRSALRPAGARVAALALPALLVVGTLLVTIDPPGPPIDFAQIEREGATLEIAPIEEADEPSETDEEALEVPDPPIPPPRIAFFGDSTALTTGMGLNLWMNETGLALPAGGVTPLGCGLGRGGERRTGPFDAHPVPQECDAWEATWREALAEGVPDVAVVQVGPWEIADRRLPGDDAWRALGDPVYDDFLMAEMLTATDLLAEEVSVVAWITMIPPGEGVAGNEHERRGHAGDPARTARFNELLRELAERRPDVVVVVDLEAYASRRGDDVHLRPDGMHLSVETATEVAADWLGPTLLEIYEDHVRAQRAAMERADG